MEEEEQQQQHLEHLAQGGDRGETGQACLTRENFSSNGLWNEATAAPCSSPLRGRE